MSKKLLNESTIRRFGALANLNPNTTNSFLQEIEDEEIVDVDSEEVMAPPEEEVLDVVDVEDLGAEEEAVDADVDGLVRDLVDHIATWAQGHGVSMAVDAGEEEEVVDDLELGDDELGDDEFGDELGLPGDEEAVDTEVETEETFDLEETIKKALSEYMKDDKEEEDLKEEEEEEDPLLGPTAKDPSKMPPELVKEVSRRVKKRLAELYKSKSK